MIAAIIFSLVLGFVLGRRFRFFVLVPAFFVVLVCVIGIGAAGGYSGWIIVLGAVVAAFVLQAGYLVGAHYRARQEAQESLRMPTMLRPPFDGSHGAPTTNLL
jgi:hypothetical protein